MNLSDETIGILKNFAVINPRIRFVKGNELKNISSCGHIIAGATLKESFPRDFIIDDLNMFLNVYSVLDSPDIEIGEKSVRLVKGNKSLNYVFSHRDDIKSISKIKHAEAFCEFDLLDDDLQKILKSADVLGIKYITFESEGDGKPVYAKAEDVKNPEDSFALETTNTSDKAFKLVHSRDDLKILRGDYKVSCTNILSILKNKALSVQYWVAIDRKLSKI